MCICVHVRTHACVRVRQSEFVFVCDREEEGKPDIFIERRQNQTIFLGYVAQSRRKGEGFQEMEKAKFDLAVDIKHFY